MTPHSASALTLSLHTYNTDRDDAESIFDLILHDDSTIGCIAMQSKGFEIRYSTLHLVVRPLLAMGPYALYSLYRIACPVPCGGGSSISH